MALEETMKATPETDGAALGEEEEQDLEIAVLMTKRMLAEGGMDTIEAAINTSSDPAQVIGQFFVQLAAQLLENLPTDLELSPRIWLSEGGWLEEIMDYLQAEAGVSKAVTDRAEIYFANAAKTAAQGQQQKQPDPNAVAAPEASVAPAMPTPAGGVM